MRMVFGSDYKTDDFPGERQKSYYNLDDLIEELNPTFEFFENTY